MNSIKSLLLPVFILAFQFSYADQINSQIKEVTVYLKGAEIKRHASSVQIPAGVHEIVFSGLSNHVDQNSIQVASKGDLIVLSSQFRLNYLDSKGYSPEYIRLKDSLEIYNDKINRIINHKNALTEEKSVLLANKQIGGQNTGVNLTDLKETAAYIRDRILQISNEIHDLSKEENNLQQRKTKIQQQMNQMDNKHERPAGELVVKVSSGKAQKADFRFTYYIPGPGWGPSYDIRVKDTGDPAQLFYKASVYQKTGVDWKDVKLTLATGNPGRNNTHPQLYTWYIDFYRPVTTYSSSGYKIERGSRSDAKAPEIAKDKSYEPAGLGEHVQLQENQLNMQFDIDIPYSIPSDAKHHQVTLQEMKLPAVYDYYTVPKQNSRAYLMARIAGWEEFNLLPGQANVFFEGAYVGKTALNPNSVKDTLLVSLGQDERINIEREQLKDFTEKSFFGDKVKETYAYEISIRNTKDDVVNIEVKDHTPVSRQDEIEVELLEAEGAEYNSETGKLVWKLKVPSGKTEKVKFIFTVKYPKDKQISNL